MFKKSRKCDIIIVEVVAMSTRMDKYYGNEKASVNRTSRSKRNKDLYGEIYTYGKYTNIEGIAEIDNANEVDITKVKEMLKNRENYQKERQYRRITGEYKPANDEPLVTKRYTELEEKNYDIRDVLKEAKEKKEPDDKERVLRNTQYNILKNIDLKKELKKEDYYEEDDEEDLKDLIQTITNTSMLNKIGDVDLAADLLSDLRDDDTKVGELKNVKELIDEQKPKKVSPNEPTYDRSFFTSSLKLNKSDFVDGEEKPRKTNVFNVIIITVLIIIMIIAGAILVMKML